MFRIYVHILHYFYAYYLPHLILHWHFCLYFVDIRSRTQFIEEREWQIIDISIEAYKKEDAELETQERNFMYQQSLHGELNMLQYLGMKRLSQMAA